jgi:hypothetical protein
MTNTIVVYVVIAFILWSLTSSDRGTAINPSDAASDAVGCPVDGAVAPASSITGAKGSGRVDPEAIPQAPPTVGAVRDARIAFAATNFKCLRFLP